MHIRTLHPTEPDHLAKVAEEMSALGAPSISVYEYDEGCFLALEGTHRLAAAHELGLTPELIKLNYDQEIGAHLSSQFQEYPEWYTVSDIFDELFASSSFAGDEYEF